MTADLAWRGPSWTHTGVLVLAFSMCVIAAGHGAGPIGLLLALGWNDEWLFQVIAGWVGVATLVFGRALSEHRTWIMHAGAVLSVISWVLFVWKSELKTFSLVSSLPYLATMALWIRRTRRP